MLNLAMRMKGPSQMSFYDASQTTPYFHVREWRPRQGSNLSLQHINYSKDDCDEIRHAGDQDDHKRHDHAGHSIYEPFIFHRNAKSVNQTTSQQH